MVLCIFCIRMQTQRSLSLFENHLNHASQLDIYMLMLRSMHQLSCEDDPTRTHVNVISGGPAWACWEDNPAKTCQLVCYHYQNVCPTITGQLCLLSPNITRQLYETNVLSMTEIAIHLAYHVCTVVALVYTIVIVYLGNQVFR